MYALETVNFFIAPCCRRLGRLPLVHPGYYIWIRFRRAAAHRRGTCWTSRTQTRPAPFWSEGEYIQDTRIPPLETDVSCYRFVLPATHGPVTVIATLIFRRTYKTWADAKKWNMEDKIMTRREQTVQPDQSAAVAPESTGDHNP